MYLFVGEIEERSDVPVARVLHIVVVVQGGVHVG